MKANELRIGNLVKDSFGVIEISITGESYFEKTIYDFGKIEFASIYEPIPLTEEWLLKFGFEKKKGYYDRYYYSIDGMDIRIDADMFETEVGECLYKTIKYVHQLQNLYFAINDEELTMK